MEVWPGLVVAEAEADVDAVAETLCWLASRSSCGIVLAKEGIVAGVRGGIVAGVRGDIVAGVGGGIGRPLYHPKEEPTLGTAWKWH